MIQWAAFLYLGIVAWGATFLWIKVALEEIGPFTIVAYRCAFGLATVLIAALLSRVRIEFRGIKFWLPVLLGVIGTAVPIGLITWSETRIDSGLAGILNASMPIWTMLIAHFAFHDDRLTVPKSAGMLLGFVGIFLLVNPKVGSGYDVVGQLAVVLAAILYAISTVLTRRHLRGVHPLQTSVPALLAATVLMFALAVGFEGGIALPRAAMTWVATAWMGIIGMGLAMQIWYWLINHWTATRVSLVTYVFPATAVALGVIILDEKLTWDLVIGGLLIVGGIALVSRPTPPVPVAETPTI